jgi:hypothetical protein
VRLIRLIPSAFSSSEFSCIALYIGSTQSQESRRVRWHELPEMARRNSGHIYEVKPLAMAKRAVVPSACAVRLSRSNALLPPFL